MAVVELKHPLVEHKLAIIRDEKTGTKEFREIIGELASILCYEALRDVELEEVLIKTPIEEMKTHKLDETKYAFVPILRAGLGMLDGIMKMVPNAKIGHIGMYRDEETFEPIEYYFKVPEGTEEKEVILLDPMLATGGSACDAIKLLKDKGVKKITFLSIISAPEGIEAVTKKYPDVLIYTTCIDRELNKNKYICPGLGDAGDRIFGTN